MHLIGWSWKEHGSKRWDVRRLTSDDLPRLQWPTCTSAAGLRLQGGRRVTGAWQSSQPLPHLTSLPLDYLVMEVRQVHDLKHCMSG
jgi:hypothetical protein